MLRFRSNRKRLVCVVLLVAALLLIVTGPAFCSAEGEHAAAEGGHAAAEGGHHVKGWVNTDTYRVINFAVLAIALFLLLRKPVANGLNARIKGIQEQLSDLQARKAEAEAKLAEYNEKLARLEQEAEQVVQGFIKQGNEAKVRIIEEAKMAAEKLEAQAKRNIEHEFKRAKEQLQSHIVAQSLLKAEEIIKRKITPEDQEKLVDEYLEKVVA
jgi:F-type H+-transporting ATPase subunit b